MNLNGIFSACSAFMLASTGLMGSSQEVFEVVPDESHFRCDGFPWGQSEAVDNASRDASIVEPIDKERDALDALRYYIVASNDELYERSVTGSPYRSYEHGVTAEEKSIISSIVLTLANTSYAKLLLKKSELDKKGSEIDHVHPLRHLACIFTDEELKVAIRNIREKSLIWKNYVHGLGESLAQEHRRDNLTDGYIRDFAGIVGIHPDLIFPPIMEARWRDFIELLVDSIPRKGNPRRYDM